MIRNLEEVGPNLQKIIHRLQTNQNLLKLLYYTGKDPLNEPDLTTEQIKNEVYEKLIKIVPKISVKETAQSIITIRVIDGVKNSNKEFKNIKIIFSVFVPLNQWMIKDVNLRPFSIMGEIEKSLSGKRVDGLGTLEEQGFSLELLTEEISGYDIQYKATIYD